MSQLQSDIKNELFWSNLFLGIPYPNNELNQLIAHQFETILFKASLANLKPHEEVYYQPLFRKFLIYVENRKINMDWKSGLYFLDWLRNKCLMDENKSIYENAITRAVYRWVNNPRYNLGYKYIIIDDSPNFTSWFVGQRSIHPTQTPKLFKVKPKCSISHPNIKYCIMENIIEMNFDWKSI